MFRKRLKKKLHRGIERVTLQGMSDKRSWMNKRSSKRRPKHLARR